MSDLLQQFRLSEASAAGSYQGFSVFFASWSLADVSIRPNLTVRSFRKLRRVLKVVQWFNEVSTGPQREVTWEGPLWMSHEISRWIAMSGYVSSRGCTVVQDCPIGILVVARCNILKHAESTEFLW